MSNLFHKHQDEVLLLFKNHYHKALSKTLELTFADVLSSVLKELGIPTAEKDDTFFLEEWFKAIHEQSFLQDFLKRPFTEIIFHSHQEVSIYGLNERESQQIPPMKAHDFQLGLEVFALRNKVTWNFKEPFASFNVVIGQCALRATLIHHSTSPNQISKLFLRSLPQGIPSLDLFDLPPSLIHCLKEMIREKKNVLISGGTGSGKTTLMRSLMGLIPPSDHVIVLEDTYEILNQHPTQTSLLASKDQANKSLKDYCAYALRMSPDRLIVGEMRSSEVVPFLLAMNTGHKGLMSTIHASSAPDALTRVALLFALFQESAGVAFSLVTKLACKNIDYVIHLENKQITEICKIIGSDEETPFYEKIYERESA